MTERKDRWSGPKAAAMAHYGFAITLSFDHIHDLVATHGQTGWKAWSYPPIVDLLIYMGWDGINGRRRGLGWFIFLVGLSASVGANVAESYLTTGSLLGVVIGAYPSIGMLLATLKIHADAEEEPEREQPAAQPGKGDTPEVPADTPKRKVPDTRTLQFPKQDSDGFLPAVVVYVTAVQGPPKPRKVAEFCRAVNASLETHGCRTYNHMTIRRAMPNGGKVTV